MSGAAVTAPSRHGVPAGGRLWWAVRTLLLTAAGIFVVGLLLGLVVVGRHGGGPIQGWDTSVERWFPAHRGPLVGVSKWIATWLDAAPLAGWAVLLSVALALALRTVRCLVPVAAYLGGEFQVFVIREIVHRHRPPTAVFPAPGSVPGVHETSYSFPSGHSVAVTAMLFALAGLVALSRRWWWPWLAAAAGSLFVCDSRLVLGVHWFSDVTFGFLLGLAWGVTVALVFRRLAWDDLLVVVPGRWRAPLGSRLRSWQRGGAGAPPGGPPA